VTFKWKDYLIKGRDTLDVASSSQRVLPNGFHRSIPAGRPEPFQVADVVLTA
jgi:hypothetical protein